MRFNFIDFIDFIDFILIYLGANSQRGVAASSQRPSTEDIFSSLSLRDLQSE